MHTNHYNTGTLIFTTVLASYLMIGESTFAWQMILNNPAGADLLKAVTTDSANNVIGAGLTTRADGDRGFVVAKFSGHDGTLLWRFELDGTAVGFDDEANALTVDSHDDVIAVGRIANAGTSYDLTVVKLNGSSGSQVWLRTIAGTANNDDVARADSADNVVVTWKITDATTSASFAVVKMS